jgi:hypothetical protein
MGEMADMLFDHWLMSEDFDDWMDGLGAPAGRWTRRGHPAVADTLWVSAAGDQYLISKLEARHVYNIVAMLKRWAAKDGRSPEDYVGAKRWANLLKRNQSFVPRFRTSK